MTEARIKCVETTPLDKTHDHCMVTLNDERKPLHSKISLDGKSQIYVEFTNLSYAVSSHRGKRKNILRDVFGRFRPGKLTAIIGPSGAGKTALLSVISGFESSNVRGSIYVNGRPRNVDEFRKSSCYIPQEFVLMPNLTTRETLRIAAALKLGSPHTPKSRERVVDEIATRLGLSNCMDTMAGRLSGGEKKRLSIGVEIITNPAAMLLDEPTSGLDSVASNQVVDMLKHIADTGCTVVCAIHQPSSRTISQLDDIFVLAEGRNFYCGPMENILETFEKAQYNCPPFYNIAEFVIEVVSGQRVGDLDCLCKVGIAKYNDDKLFNEVPRRRNVSGNEADVSTSDSSAPNYSKDYSESKMDDGETSPVSTWDKQIVLLNRAALSIQRDNTMTKLRWVTHVIVGLLLGLVFYDIGKDVYAMHSNFACMFFFVLFLFFANAMPAVQMFPIEAAVFLREHLNNWYSLGSYYIAKVVTDLPLQVICPTCFLLIAYTMTGQPLELGTFTRVWVVCILITILAQSVGIATGAAFDTHIGCFLVPALNIPMILFAGFFLKINEVPTYLRPIADISYFRHGFAGILQAIRENRGLPECTSLTEDCAAMFEGLILSEKFGVSQLITQTSFTTSVTSLIAWILCLHLTIYSVLRWKLHRATK